MTTKDSKDTKDTKEEAQYATGDDEDQAGKPVGPEHDASFSAPDFYDPQTGKRVETPWDSELQKQDPGFDPEVMAGTVEKRPAKSSAKSASKSSGKSTAQSGEKHPSQPGEGEGGASGGEGGEPTTGTKQAPISTPSGKENK